MSDYLDLVVDGLREGDQRSAKAFSAPNNIETGYLSERQFNQLTERLIHLATEDGILASDAVAALAKALGTLSTFAARREGLPVEEVLGVTQETVATFARAAASYMNQNPDTDPASL